MSVNEEQNIMSNEFYDVCQPFYLDNSSDDVLTSYPSQNPIDLHAQSHTLPSAAASSLPNMTAMDAIDYMNAASDYVSNQETANHSHCPSNIHTINGLLNISSHYQVGNSTNNSYPAPVFFQTLPGFSAPDVDNDYPSNPALNQSSISYIFTQMPMQTSHLSNNSNEFANPGYAVTKVECTHLGMISAADVDKILTVSREWERNSCTFVFVDNAY